MAYNPRNYDMESSTLALCGNEVDSVEINNTRDGEWTRVTDKTLITILKGITAGSTTGIPFDYAE